MSVDHWRGQDTNVTGLEHTRRQRDGKGGVMERGLRRREREIYEREGLIEDLFTQE